MATLVIHGTFDSGGTWWREETEGSFLEALAEGMRTAGFQPDIWQVGGQPVDSYPELMPEGTANIWTGRTPPPFDQVDGRFRWSGQNFHDIGRREAGPQLARYLEAIAALAPDEEIDLIGHSHGGNVIKLAVSLAGPQVRIGRLVFLATPHFEAADGGSYPYRLAVDRLAGHDDGLAAVLNVYSKEDSVQVGIADGLPDMGLPPGLPGLEALGFGGTPLVNASRTDRDPEAAAAYDNVAVLTDFGGGVKGGAAAHAALHGPMVGLLAGLWLGSWPHLSGEECLTQLGLDQLPLE